jgi:hypothetical protein
VRPRMWRASAAEGRPPASCGHHPPTHAHTHTHARTRTRTRTRTQSGHGQVGTAHQVRSDAPRAARPMPILILVISGWLRMVLARPDDGPASQPTSAARYGGAMAAGRRAGAGVTDLEGLHAAQPGGGRVPILPVGRRLSSGGGSRGEGQRQWRRRCPRPAQSRARGATVERRLPGRFHPQFRDKNRRGVGKSQSKWPASKMETPGSPPAAAWAARRRTR